MGTPNVTVNIEPGDGISVFYLILAPNNLNDIPTAQVSIKLLINNPGTETYHLNLIKISFVGVPHVNDTNIPVDVIINPNATTYWHFNVDNNLILPFPTPPSMTISLFCDDFSDPVTVDRLLSAYQASAYQSSFSLGAYFFPAQFKDLRNGEYWVGTSGIHAPAGDGSQLFAYDMDVIAYDSDKNAFTSLLPGGSEGNNADYRIWEKRIYAMADGKIVSSLNDQPTNLNPPADLSPPGPVEGNHFYIQHGEELVLYAHMIEGTLESRFLKDDPDEVRMGDFLGLAGNSGNSTNPHLHIHAIKGNAAWGGPLRPIPFRSLQVLAVSDLQTDVNHTWPPKHGDINQPWAPVYGQGLPPTRSAIWPGLSITIPKREIEKWKAIIYILFGGTSDAGGLGYFPSGRPIPIDPWDPLKHLSPSKRDIILGLALTEIASIANDSKSKVAIEKIGIDVITKALQKLKSL